MKFKYCHKYFSFQHQDLSKGHLTPISSWIEEQKLTEHIANCHVQAEVVILPPRKSKLCCLQTMLKTCSHLSGAASFKWHYLQLQLNSDHLYTASIIISNSTPLVCSHLPWAAAHSGKQLLCAPTLPTQKHQKLWGRRRAAHNCATFPVSYALVTSICIYPSPSAQAHSFLLQKFKIHSWKEDRVSVTWAVRAHLHSAGFFLKLTNSYSFWK